MDETARWFGSNCPTAFMDNEGFERWMTDTVYGLMYGASLKVSRLLVPSQGMGSFPYQWTDTDVFSLG
jgi:hypothetical protein